MQMISKNWGRILTFCLMLAGIIFSVDRVANSGKRRAIYIAREEYKRREGDGKVDCDANKQGADWWVTIYPRPATVDHYLIVQISSEWKVVSYENPTVLR